MKLIKPPEMVDEYFAIYDGKIKLYYDGDQIPNGPKYKGRRWSSNCIIQFDEPYDPLEYDKIDIVIDGYKLFGMFPFFHLGENKFECCVDFFEKVA